MIKCSKYTFKGNVYNETIIQLASRYIEFFFVLFVYMFIVSQYFFNKLCPLEKNFSQLENFFPIGQCEVTPHCRYHNSLTLTQNDTVFPLC